MKNLDSLNPFSGKSILPILSALVILTFSSCFGSRPVSYFSQGQVDSLPPEQIKIPDQVIQKGDILSITIYSDNPEATAIYNQATGGVQATSVSVQPTRGLAGQSSSSGPMPGYLVDNKGMIRMHAIGEIRAEGMRKDQLGDTIVARLAKLDVLTNPYCVIRFNNFKISILGEVKNPGVFSLSGEKTSILEALGLAGDISDYGLKDRVLLIRETDGYRTYSRLNLLDPKITSSPNFYLRQNDVLLVEADRRKPTAMDQQTLSYITVGATVVSAIAILFTLFK